MRTASKVAVLVISFILPLLLIAFSPRNRFANDDESGERGASGALQSIDFWTRARAYPAMDIPQREYFTSYQRARSRTKELRSSLTAGGAWDPMGPVNLQGRALCVAFNPQNPSTVYVGTASGGLWRSFSGGIGTDWRQVKLGLPALGIGAIVVDPADSNVMYLGTGEVYGYQSANLGLAVRTMRGSYGIGILKSIDGGQTWAKSLDWSYNNKTGVEAMRLNPLNHNSIWAATTEGLYASPDAGTSWHSVLDTLLAEDVVINSSDTTLMLASFGDLNSPGTGVYLSTNSGATWSKCAGFPSYTGKTRLEMYELHPNVVYASEADSTTGVGGLWRTTDFGVSWTMLSDYTTNGIFQVQGWYSHFVAVHPLDSSQVVHASVPISKSNDGGRTFFLSSGSYSDHHNYAHHPTDPNILYVVNDDGVYRSDDFGGSYRDVGIGMQTGQFYNGFSCSASDSLLALGQCQDHIPGYRYLGTLQWDHGSATDEVGWTAIDQSYDAVMYAVDRNGTAIYQSINRGVSFSWLASFDGSGCWNTPFVLSPSSRNVLYVGDVHIHKSTNFGVSWTVANSGISLDGNPALSMAISASSADTVYVGTAPVSGPPHVFRTTNGGTNWLDITGVLPNRYPLDIATDPESTSTVYVTMGGFGSGHVFKSTDAGGTWSDVTGALPDVPTDAVVVDPLHSSNVYVGNDLGVYVSTDGGTTWSGFSEGLPDAVIAADLEISPSNRALRVATHGNGVWERKLIQELPSNYFDYKTSAVNSPIDGSRYNVGDPVSLGASFRNLSLQTQIDSFNVRFRVFHHDSLFVDATRREAALSAGQEIPVSFGTYAPADTGFYVFQAICSASDMNQRDDTLSVSILELSPPTIGLATVTKEYSPYTEITLGSPGPSGDDVESRAGIPFAFKYDNVWYDSVQMSTNGWVELGTGPEGSLYGLSTPSQVGGYFIPALASQDRPTKVLGPWWADLSTNGSVGQISYKTLGVAPNRIFVIQWKNILAYYDASSTSTYLNYQVRLYETSNLIDFAYGPLVAGTFPGGATGASIGFKDYIGGDYRYYDISRMRTGPAGELVSSLNPLVNWPGQDSVFHIATYGITSVNGGKLKLPSSYRLEQNYPNPFNPVTTISYDLPTASKVVVKVFDLQGRVVRTLVDGVQGPGTQSTQWNSTNLNASLVSSGIYIYRIEASSLSRPDIVYTGARKMVLLK